MNIRDFLQTRPLSWSAISKFEYDPEEWFRKYILGEKTIETIEMKFGKAFASAIEDGKPLAPVTIIHGPEAVPGKNVEYPFKVVLRGIPLVGYADTFDDRKCKRLGEFKTGKKAWDQKRVDEHGQITMYLLMNFIQNKVPPEEVSCFLEWIPTTDTGDFNITFLEPVTVHPFETKRTMADIINFGKRIESTIDAMQAFVDQKLSTSDALPNEPLSITL